MGNLMSDNIEEYDDIDKLEENIRREERVLARLLDGVQHKTRHHMVMQVNMGEVQSYLTSVTLSWVAENVNFANDLPVFMRDEGGYGSTQPTPGDLEERKQRIPNWTRQRDMAAYLASRRHHKFPALLLVGYQGWVYDEKSEKWGEDSRAMSDSLTIRNLDSTGMCWELDDSNTFFYALDGQHRLMAIRGLRELIQDGHLPARDKQGRVKPKDGLSRDDIIQQTGEDRVEAHERLQRLMNERIGIEIIPAIRRDETEEEGRRRLRQMFVDVNEHAKPLTKGEVTQLDESNGYRVVARRLVMSHPLLCAGTSADGKPRPKIEEVKTQLNESADRYTTLVAMVEIVRAYLKENATLNQHEKYVSWDNLLAKGIFIRPEDSLLDEATKDITEYLDLLAGLPSHLAFIQGKPAGELRSKEPNDDNILFRPLVQVALAEAIGLLAARGSSPKNIIQTLAAKEIEGQLKLRDRKGPWFGVLCDANGKMRRHKKNRELCCRLFVFLLGGGAVIDTDREMLWEDFVDQRIFDPVEGKAIDLEGNPVDIENVQLPNPWR